jgi:hypothetical protein
MKLFFFTTLLNELLLLSNLVEVFSGRQIEAANLVESKRNEYLTQNETPTLKENVKKSLGVPDGEKFLLILLIPYQILSVRLTY